MKIFVLAIFLLTYFLLILKRDKAFLFLGSAIALLLLSRAITLQSAIASINLNVLGVFLGTMILSALFIYSDAPAYLAVKLIKRTKTTAGAILVICALAGFISSFTENVSTILIVAPLAFEVAKKLNTSPVPFIIGIALSSNLQGCATMIGDSPSIILALSHGMNFMDFFWFKNRAGIFFAVELGALSSFFVLYLLFKKYKAPVKELEEVKVKSWIPTGLLVFLVFTLVAISFIKNKPNYLISFVCLLYGILGAIWHKLSHKESISLIRDLDWHTFFFLIGIFVLVGSLNTAGIIEDLANTILRISGQNKFLTYSIVVWFSVFVSAFVDNIPYTMAMIPVAKLVAGSLGLMPELLLFGLLIGTCLGGNITPIGASANVVGVGFLRKRGYKISFFDFVKLGFPFTLSAVIVGYMFLWFVWR